MDVTALLALVQSRKLDLGALIEVFLTNKADMGTNQLHPQVHLSDGFEIDDAAIGAQALSATTKAIAEPHKTAQASLQSYINGGGSDPVTRGKLQAELDDANAAKTALLTKLQASKKLAHSPDSHIDPSIYKDLERDSFGAPDKSFFFDVSRLPDFEARETIRKKKLELLAAEQELDKLGYGAADRASKRKLMKGAPNYAAINDVVGKWKSLGTSIASNEANLASGVAGGSYLTRGSGHAKNKSHSMFSDSESALMALFGALNTEAGELGLKALLGAAPVTNSNGSVSNPRIAIHSYSAPLYLTSKALKGAKPTSVHTGRAAASTVGSGIQMVKRAGNFATGLLESRALADIKYVSVILEKEGTTALLVTHFPVPSDGPDEVVGANAAGSVDVLEKPDKTKVAGKKEMAKGDWLTPST